MSLNPKTRRPIGRQLATPARNVKTPLSAPSLDEKRRERLVPDPVGKPPPAGS